MNGKKLFIKRDIFEDLKKHLFKKEITLIVGPRQVGKTTLMMLLKEHLEKNGEKTIFLSLDFENDQKFFSSQSALTERLKLEFGEGEGYVFIDDDSNLINEIDMNSNYSNVYPINRQDFNNWEDLV